MEERDEADAAVAGAPNPDVVAGAFCPDVELVGATPTACPNALCPKGCPPVSFPDPLPNADDVVVLDAVGADPKGFVADAADPPNAD